MGPKVIVFAKSPKAGAVKTRLGAVMSAASAAGLHFAMVTDLIGQLQQLHPAVDLELHITEPTDAFSFLHVVTRVQVPGTLGERLLAAILDALERERRPAVLVMGSDSPTIPLTHIHELLAT